MMNELDDIIIWDQVNWKKALSYWDQHIPIDKNSKALELGGHEGGLSLWLALKGFQIVCSDLENPEEKAKVIHQKYTLKHEIAYQAIDATAIPYQNTFDIICFKSILGGIARNGNDALKKETIDGIYNALKPGGKLLFAENLSASALHQFFRKKFVKWGAEWNYLAYHEMDEVFSTFDNVRYTTVGFLGAFGRNEKQRRFLGKIDTLFEKIVPSRLKYITIGVAEKKHSS